ncbi:MBL fold metallo-hydrolase [Salinicoccus albus]|uniref:MBL fold metallo-hydrolase n=1 Tax=Salinicoccus albus TaxID=418756 RepID=UPI00036C5FBC|nr:MBL fold metallo-hydrolase [Salinicoccus albus]
MEIKTLPLGMLETNCYILNNEKSVLIIDPSGEPEVIRQTVEEIGKPVEGILLTHAHFDHIGALDSIAETYNTAVWLGGEESDWLSDPSKNGSGKYRDMGIEPIVSDISPEVLKEGAMHIGSFSFESIHTPGHSPGSMSFLFEDFIISGDVLFNGGIGRTDLYRGDHMTLLNTIEQKLYALDADTEVYPGHGPSTVIGKEKTSNPFIRR